MNDSARSMITVSAAVHYCRNNSLFYLVIIFLFSSFRVYNLYLYYFHI